MIGAAEDKADPDYGARVLAALRGQGYPTTLWPYAAITAMEKASRLEFLALFKKHSSHVSYALIEFIRTAEPEALAERLIREKAASE